MAGLLLSLTNFIVGIVEFLIGLRIILRLFGASSQAPFVQWVYETTQPLLQPFIGMFPSPLIEGGFVLEFSALFALVIYGFIGYLIQYVIMLIDRSSRIDEEHVVVKRKN